MSEAQPYNREQAILEKMKPFMDEGFANSGQELQQEFEKRGYLDWERLETILNKLLLQGKQLQEEQKKGKIQFVVFSYLQGEALENRIEIKIDLFDEGFYLDMEECTGYFRPEIMQAQYIQDIKKLHKETEKNFIRLQIYELQEIEKSYATRYRYICGLMLKSMADLIMEVLSKSDIMLAEDIRLIYGAYMDKAVDFTRR